MDEDPRKLAERPFGRLSEIPKIPRTAFCPFSPENETASTISAKIPRFCQMASEPKNALKMPEIIKFLPGVGIVLSEVRNHVCEVKNSLSVARMTMSKRADVVGHAEQPRNDQFYPENEEASGL